ncbi:hypothetical protein OU995_18595 [Roseateles sp. SL47]|uniref:hypothetical protein n=1 Tax=Roseateles sp. SL47 TaxID=2995138 RepID=UPI0022700078|nr:hypothetical protein [Roseateles sp. SL47]WAC71581.1 hypothetical protein OU995_18595 [Roseateles sp. SL47]
MGHRSFSWAGRTPATEPVEPALVSPSGGELPATDASAADKPGPRWRLGAGVALEVALSFSALFSIVASLALLALLSGCGSGPRPATAPRTAAPDKVPAEVASALKALARREGVPPDGRVLMQEMELGPSGPRVLMASGTRELCGDGNCPYGLFADEGTQYRALLLAMASTPPKPQALGRMGYPDIHVTANDSALELRTTTLQWDGRSYRPVVCRLVNAMSDASRGCVPTRAEQAPVVEGPPLRYCVAMSRMVSREAAPQDGQTLLADAFEIRADADARVEGIRMEGRVADTDLDALVRCLRNTGAGFERLKAARWSQDLNSAGWVVRGMKAKGGPVSAALTATFVPAGDYTLISLAVFGAGALP